MHTLQRRGPAYARLALRSTQTPRTAVLSPSFVARYHSSQANGHYSYFQPKWKVAVGACVGGLVCFWLSNTQSSCESDEAASEPLPKFSRAEVAKHKTVETGIWVIYKNGVYDITEFVEQHPGGLEKIMLAAGSNIDPFWRMYQQHNVPHIREILEMYRIGDLVESDIRKEEPVGDDPYANDPERLPLFFPLIPKSPSMRNRRCPCLRTPSIHQTKFSLCEITFQFLLLTQKNTC